MLGVDQPEMSCKHPSTPSPIFGYAHVALHSLWRPILDPDIHLLA